MCVEFAVYAVLYLAEASVVAYVCVFVDFLLAIYAVFIGGAQGLMGCIF